MYPQARIVLGRLLEQASEGSGAGAGFSALCAWGARGGANSGAR